MNSAITRNGAQRDMRHAARLRAARVNTRARDGRCPEIDEHIDYEKTQRGASLPRAGKARVRTAARTYAAARAPIIHHHAPRQTRLPQYAQYHCYVTRKTITRVCAGARDYMLQRRRASMISEQQRQG